MQGLADDIEANIVLYPLSDVCADGSMVFNALSTEKTEWYLYSNPAFSSFKESENVYTLHSSAIIKGTPRLQIKLDCNNTDAYGPRVTVYYMYKGVFILSAGQLIKSVKGSATPKY